MLFDYPTLRVIWWALLGILLIGFAVMDGFDLGAALSLPWLAKNDQEKRVVLNAIAPTWEGNQVWFILGGGAIFAAWPALYALSFSGFYYAMLAVLLALILRPVGFKYRSKLDNPIWRQAWDIALCLSGLVPALVFGVAIGNTLQGIPFYFDHDLRAFYTGDFFELFNPFALLCGILSVCMLAMHGAYFIRIKTDGVVHQRASKVAGIFSYMVMFLFALGGFWIYQGIDGFSLMQAMPHDGPSNPLYKFVVQKTGAWLQNYYDMPWMLSAPLLGLLAPIVAVISKKRYDKFAFVCSALAIIGIISTVGLSMFPFILPSSTHPGHSLTVWDSSSSHLTLLIMLLVTVIFLPIVMMYTAWVYRVLRGKITETTLQENHEIGY